jgi:hypothetical protein
MLDLAGSTAGHRAPCREDRGLPAARAPGGPFAKRFPAHASEHVPLIAPPGEHAFRNGIGAPLLC